MVGDGDRTVVNGGAGEPAAEATVALGAEGEALAFAAGNRTQMAVSSECPVCHTSNPPGEIYCGDCGFLLASTPGAVLEAEDAQPRLVAADGREFALNPGRNRVGRIDADLLVADPSVSRTHAAITFEGGHCRVEDLGSTNGTWGNGQRLTPNVPRDRADGDAVAFGAVILRVVRPEGVGLEAGQSEGESEAAPAAAASPAYLVAEESGTEYPLPVGTTTIGRRSANTLAFPGDPYLSGRHAEVRFEDMVLTFMDLGSTNGSFLNEERVPPHEVRTLSDGDLLVLGQQRLRVRLEPVIEAPDDRC